MEPLPLDKAIFAFENSNLHEKLILDFLSSIFGGSTSLSNSLIVPRIRVDFGGKKPVIYINTRNLSPIFYSMGDLQSAIILRDHLDSLKFDLSYPLLVAVEVVFGKCHPLERLREVPSFAAEIESVSSHEVAFYIGIWENFFKGL